LIKYLPYQFIGIGLVIFMASFLYLPSISLGQDTGGKKLEVSEKGSPSKMDTKKVNTSKKLKAKGNPNRGSNKVIVVNPFTWDWDKVMWFKAKKSDYETKEYNPDKRPKRQTYDNQPNYKSADRKAITNPSELRKPLIPYDSRIADEGPVLQKKKKPKNVNLLDGGPQSQQKPISLSTPSETLSKAPKKEKNSNVEGKKLYSKRKDTERKPFDNGKLETASTPDVDSKMDEDKIMYRSQKNDYPKMDNDKLMTATVNDGKRNKFDNDKLLTSEPANRDRKAYDDSKLMTDLHGDRERKPFDNDKLLTAQPANPKRQKYDEEKLMTASVSKPKKQDLHDDRLLTAIEKKKPTDEMKETSKDISKLEGDYQKHFYVSSESHPGTKILAAENTNLPFFAKTYQSVSSFFSNIWGDNTQPNYVTRKKPKEKRDKKEGQIWDNSVHPNEWKKQEAESGEQ